jgi:glycosyltransferase involved in cell wall biosynthesis
VRSSICGNESLASQKILVIHPYFYIIGGAEQVLLKILEALVEQKQDCSLLGELPEDSTFNNLYTLNVKQISYSDTNFRPTRFPTHQCLLRHLKLQNKLRKKVGKMDLEVSTQEPMYFIGAGKKRVAYIHFPANLTRMQNSNLKHRWFWKLFYSPITFQLRQQIKRVDLLICNSYYTQRAIMDCWGREAEVIYPPVDVESFKPLQKELLVVSVGRFVPTKNYELIVEVAKQMPDVQFIIAGRKSLNDSYYDKIVSLKPDNLTLDANATLDNVSVLLGRAKVYLHCMVGEHFGISVGEAMAAGCVPVVHDSGGPVEIVSGLGFLYDDVEECVKAVRKALQSTVDPQVFVEHARLFGVDVFKKNFVSLLEKNNLL